MRILRNPGEAGRLFPAPVVAIGKFDAMHRGHLRVVRSALKRARALKTACLIVTFDPSPEQFLRIFRRQPVISLGERLDRLNGLGVDGVLLLAFDEKLACLSPESFVRDVLELRLKPVSVFVGEDFCFGKDRAGNVATLEKLGPRAGFTVHAIPLVREGGEKISATRIRALLDKGRAKEAEKLLGRRLR